MHVLGCNTNDAVAYVLDIRIRRSLQRQATVSDPMLLYKADVNTSIPNTHTLMPPIFRNV